MVGFVVVSGSIYLAGGGSADDEGLLWSRMLTGRPRVLYWPFALTGPILGTADGWLRGRLADHLAAPTVSTWESLDGHTPDELSGFDLLWVGGGNTFRLLDHVRRHGFLEPVRQRVAEGLEFYGGSAGAVLACETITIAEGHDSNENAVSDLSALGLISGAAILPHYTIEQEPSARSWARLHGETVIGLPSRSGLAVSNSRAEVVGYEPAWLIDVDGVNPYLPGATIEVAL